MAGDATHGSTVFGLRGNEHDREFRIYRTCTIWLRAYFPIVLVAVVATSVLSLETMFDLIGILIVAGIFLAALWLCLRLILGTRAAVCITRKAVHLMGPWWERTIPLADVEAVEVHQEGTPELDVPAAGIGLPVGENTAQWLQITAPGFRKKLFLYGDEQACAEALHGCCPNAVFIDADGNEHLPDVSQSLSLDDDVRGRVVGDRSPPIAVRNLARARKRSGVVLLAFGIVALAWSVPLLYLALTGGGDASASEHAKWGMRTLLKLLVIGVLCVLGGVVQIRRAHRGSDGE